MNCGLSELSGTSQEGRSDQDRRYPLRLAGRQIIRRPLARLRSSRGPEPAKLPGIRRANRRGCVPDAATSTANQTHLIGLDAVHLGGAKLVDWKHGSRSRNANREGGSGERSA